MYKSNNPLPRFYLFLNILCYSLIHVIVLAMKTIFTNSNTTKSSLSDSTNQKKEKSISDLLVIVRLERVASHWHLLRLNRRLMQE